MLNDLVGVFPRNLIGAGILGLALQLAACGDDPLQVPPLQPLDTRASIAADAGDLLSAEDSALTGPLTVETRSAASRGVYLPVETRVRVTLVARDAAWWHSLHVISPEQRDLAEPGYLFPGPSFDLGPYPAGSVFELLLKAYNPRPPHQYFGDGQSRISGAFPSWTVEFEDGFDNSFDDIVVTVEALDVAPHPILIVEIRTPLPDSSFTTRVGENNVQLRAEVSDPGVTVQWMVEDDPSDQVASGNPTAPPGLSTQFTVPDPADPLGRWPAEHPGSLSQKALSYMVRAYYVEGTDTTWSDPVTVRQAEPDVLRQEYIDYRKQTVPARGEVGVYSTTHFSAGELNFGDYGVFLATVRLRAGLEAFRDEVRQVLENAGTSFPGLTLTSAFRNPVHHHEHAGARARESQHLYGNAADVRIHNLGFTRDEMFSEMEIIAKNATVDACYEPESIVRDANAAGILTHFHIDFRAVDCPPGW